MQAEKSIQNLILNYLNNFVENSIAYEIYNGGVPACARGSRVIYKKNGPYRFKGWPDIVWIWRGEVTFIETKTKAKGKTVKGYLSADQKEIHAKITDCGGRVIVIRSLLEIQNEIGTRIRK